MTDKEIQIKIKEIVEQNDKAMVLLQDQEVNMENLNFVNDFGFDSIDLVVLIEEIENQFNLSINAEELCIENISNYTYLCELVSKYVKDGK